MKRILSIFFVIMVIAMAFTCVYAEGNDAVVEGGIVVDDKATWDDYLEGITNSTMWTAVGSVIIGITGMVVAVIKKVNSLSGSTAGKTDIKAINEQLKLASTELSKIFNSRIDYVESRLNDTDSNEKILITVLTIFMTNANINPNAKAEIMKYLAGIKDVNASVSEMVDTANKIIQEANEAEVKEPTPALDSIVKEETESKMVLG